MPTQWTQDLSVGVDKIDNQHKELFKSINNLFDAMKQGKGKDEVSKLTNFLADYVVTHFGTEEKYIADHSYPGAISHKMQHSAFITELTALKSNLEKGEATTTYVIQIQKQVTDWLINHIGKTDKLSGAFLKTKV